ncbi:vesicle transport protein SEC20 isoform X1 [Pygocentrus nattereri]|uniref:vesicle transport protein SEC20 isoform X1 n=1 Tax=Pygocentrus nattereri TaxID=42514 RepID=UPI00189142ED|nr:vesicle transport protein SEC20 isoform X1 [Pygocentrus nattereri]
MADVHVRICEQEIIKYDLEIKALIQDISECTGPQSELTELNCNMKDRFSRLRQRIQVSYKSMALGKMGFSSQVMDPFLQNFSQQDLEQMGREQDKESDKLALLKEVEAHRKQMLSNQTAWRKANLASNLAIDKLEKEELLNDGDTTARQRKLTKESLAQTSSDITESLMSISRMMSQQVKQSEETISTLATSSRTVLETNEEFKTMTGTIQLGRKLITKYNRRELTDKLLIFLALALFLATVLYILKKRLFPFL